MVELTPGAVGAVQVRIKVLALFCPVVGVDVQFLLELVFAVGKCAF